MRALISGEGFCPVAGTSSDSFLGLRPNRAKRGNPVRGSGEAEPLLSLRSSNSSYRIEQYRIDQYITDRVEQTINTCSTPIRLPIQCQKEGK